MNILIIDNRNLALTGLAQPDDCDAPDLVLAATRRGQNTLAYDEQTSNVAMAGPVVDWLHLALTGHRIGQDPLQASPNLARCARAYIESRVDDDCFVYAQEVISQWGAHIWPGFDTAGLMYDLRTNSQFKPVTYVHATRQWLGRNVKKAKDAD